MALDPFNSAGGYTVGIPPIQIVDSHGNVTVPKANIATLEIGEATSSGNITAPNFIGNIVGNISGNIALLGPHNSVVYNQDGIALGSDQFTYDSTTNEVTVKGDLITNTITIGANNNEFSTTSTLYAVTTSAAADQVLHSIQANTISSIDYMIIATDRTANTRQTSKLIASILGTDVGYYEYGTIDMNGGVGDFKVVHNTGNIELTVTPMVAHNTDYKIMITSYKEGI